MPVAPQHARCVGPSTASLHSASDPPSLSVGIHVAPKSSPWIRDLRLTSPLPLQYSLHIRNFRTEVRRGACEDPPPASVLRPAHRPSLQLPIPRSLVASRLRVPPHIAAPPCPLSHAPCPRAQHSQRCSARSTFTIEPGRVVPALGLGAPRAYPLGLAII
ncbi:hypothetical protein HYPSUDRAFT_204347 [Hypholoma sublateritium FD-334 SS-4]|uniref:Uncharacterized protein n=1 Tax=Hypholoma sublateritium (strain FD-334 SS-4) TaxID=945553 RepID=A0A0D2PIB1_HYPSF|nr:hypothetical protein HYPSUDRAFT_204347 [Hypholoma sublateritium FD-334 SS-4]